MNFILYQNKKIKKYTTCKVCMKPFTFYRNPTTHAVVSLYKFVFSLCHQNSGSVYVIWIYARPLFLPVPFSFWLPL